MVAHAAAEVQLWVSNADGGVGAVPSVVIFWVEADRDDVPSAKAMEPLRQTSLVLAPAAYVCVPWGGDGEEILGRG